MIFALDLIPNDFALNVMFVRTPLLDAHLLYACTGCAQVLPMGERCPTHSPQARRTVVVGQVPGYV